MKKPLLSFYAVLAVFILLSGLAMNLQAQDKNAFKQYFSPKAENLTALTLDQSFSQNTTISPFHSRAKIYALGLSADVTLNNKAGLVRVILVDREGSEYLVYETYPVISSNNSARFSVENIAEETFLLPGIIPVSLQIQVMHAMITVKQLAVSYTTPEYDTEALHALRKTTLDAQHDAKIEQINANNRLKGIEWTAGKTDQSHLPYSKKKMLVNGDYTMNLQGFEYYKGGVFIYDMGEEDAEVRAMDPALRALPERWDWRERHGANKQGSPYYDGDANKGGWFTAIQSQSCNHCWAFAPTATIEVLTNLYFNQHLNLNLSEQNVAACGGGASGKCEGGTSAASINYIANTGVVEEACMPYKASDDVACSSVCPRPTDRIKAASRISIGNNPTEAAMKKYIMDYGPVSSGVQGMWHFMCLAGFYKDNTGSNVWIFKNSYGVNSGEKGFANIKITGSGKTNYLYGNFALRTPLTSLNTYSVACNDKDGDGYYYWGIGTQPATCPSNTLNQADGDDSDPCTGPLDANYAGVSLKPVITSPQLQHQTVKSGSTVTFSITASGGNFIRYQWTKNGIHLAGETNATLTLNNVMQSHEGAYACMVKTRCDSVLSNSASLQVNVLTGEFDVIKNNINMQVFPNPASGSSTVGYFLPSKTLMRLSVLNVLGEEALVLINDQVLERGTHSVKLDTGHLKPGVYFCKLSFANYAFVKTLIVSGAEH